MKKVNKYRIVNYPQTVSDCHSLIDLLVMELNAASENKSDVCATPADDRKYQMPFSAPSGCNGGSERDGGVGFIRFGDNGITPAYAE